MTGHRTIFDFTAGKVYREGDPGFEERWTEAQARAARQVTTCSGIPADYIRRVEQLHRKRFRRKGWRVWLFAFGRWRGIP